MADIEIAESKIKQTVPYRADNEAPPPKKGEKKAVELTDEELEERRKNVLKSMGYDEDLAKDDPKQQTPEEIEAARVAAEAAAAKKPPEETAEEKKKREEDEALEAQQEAERERQKKEDERIVRVAAETAKAVKDAMAPAKPAEGAVPDPLKLDPVDRADLEAVEWLAANEPAKLPKGVTPQTFTDYYKALYAYRDKWLKDNEGKEFNAADEEHREFVEKHQPDVDIKDIDEAREDVKVKRAVEPYRKQVEARIEQMEVKEILKSTEPKVGNAINQSIVKLAAAVAPEVHKIITKDGKINLDAAAIAEIDKADPIAKVVLEEVIAQELSPAIVVLEQSLALGNRFPWDVNNVHHQRILDEIIACDAIMSEAPAKLRTRDGKQFMTMADMHQKRGAILSGTGSQQDKTAALNALDEKNWTLSADDLQATLVESCADKAMKKINYQAQLAAKANGKEFVPRTKGARSQSAAPTVKPATGKDKPAPPRMGGGADLIAPPGGGSGAPKSFGETAVATHFR